MDLTETKRPVLHPLVEELLGDERLAAYAEALPAPARVSEAGLPLLLAALHEHLGRSLVVLLPEDADARDAAEAARWLVGADRVALLPSRGVRFESGLEPPPHLVGERARALDVLAAGGLVCASASALAEPLPPPDARPEPIVLDRAAAPGLDALAERFALAGYERVDRVQERGQFAVRGGLVDVFPTTGRDPLRVELFGDEVEALRAFSPFTQRTLHDVERALVYPATERRVDLVEPSLPDTSEGLSLGHVPDDLVPPLGRPPDFVWQPDEVRAVWEEELWAATQLGNTVLLDGVAELEPLPHGQVHAFEAQRPALAARGLAEAETELSALLRAGNRVVVAFPHRGEALRTMNLLRRVDARLLEQGEPLPDEPELLFAVSPARRGFVWRDLRLALLPDTQVFRRRTRSRVSAPGRALQSFADLGTGDYVVHEDHGIGKLLGFETKTVAGVTRDYLFLGFRGDDRLYVPHEQIGMVSRYIGSVFV
jgi:transcription-repair coupling factor (superfamily II helicase)